MCCGLKLQKMDAHFYAASWGENQPKKFFINIVFCIKKSCIFAVRNFKEYIKRKVMKKDIHPKEYRAVVFKDMSNETAFLTRSTVQTKDTIVWEDGKEYPLIKLEISNTSHPFFTGKMKLVDTAGRVDKFRNKYAKHPAKKD